MNQPEPTSGPPSAAVGRTAFFACALVLSLALAVAVAWVDYLPTNDGPQHIFAAYLQGHLHQPGMGWDRYLDHGALITGSGFVSLLGFLDRLLPWRLAFRVGITLAALCWAWSVLALAVATGSRRRWLGLLGFATALQWQFYMGLFSCYLATAVGFLVLALAFRDGLQRRDRLLLLTALFAIEAWLHIVPATFTGLALIAFALLSLDRGNRKSRLARALTASTPAALIGVMAIALAGGKDQLSRYGVSPSLVERMVLLGRAFVSGPAWRAWPVTLLALGAGAWAVVRWRAHDDARIRALTLAGLLMLALARWPRRCTFPAGSSSTCASFPTPSCSWRCSRRCI